MRSVSRCLRAAAYVELKTTTSALPVVLERREDHRLAPLRRQLLHTGDDSAHDDDLAVAAPLDVRERSRSCA